MIADPSSQPPSTSVNQCAPRYTRDVPISAVKSTSRARPTRRPRRESRSSSRSSSTNPSTTDVVVCPDGNEPSSASASPGEIGGRLRSITSLPRLTVEPSSSTAEAHTTRGARLRRTQLSTAPPTSRAGPMTENVPNHVIRLKIANPVVVRWRVVKSRTAPSRRISGLWRTTPTTVTRNASSATPPHPATWVTHRGRWLIRPGYPGRLAATRRTVHGACADASSWAA